MEDFLFGSIVGYPSSLITNVPTKALLLAVTENTGSVKKMTPGRTA